MENRGSDSDSDWEPISGTLGKNGEGKETTEKRGSGSDSDWDPISGPLDKKRENEQATKKKGSDSDSDWDPISGTLGKKQREKLVRNVKDPERFGEKFELYLMNSSLQNNAGKKAKAKLLHIPHIDMKVYVTALLDVVKGKSAFRGSAVELLRHWAESVPLPWDKLEMEVRADFLEELIINKEESDVGTICNLVIAQDLSVQPHATLHLLGRTESAILIFEIVKLCFSVRDEATEGGMMDVFEKAVSMLDVPTLVGMMEHCPYQAPPRDYVFAILHSLTMGEYDECERLMTDCRSDFQGSWARLAPFEKCLFVCLMVKLLPNSHGSLCMSLLRILFSLVATNADEFCALTLISSLLIKELKLLGPVPVATKANILTILKEMLWMAEDHDIIVDKQGFMAVLEQMEEADDLTLRREVSDCLEIFKFMAREL